MLSPLSQRTEMAAYNAPEHPKVKTTFLTSIGYSGVEYL